MTMTEMPKYKCHKEVGALKITGMEPTVKGALLETADGHDSILVDNEWWDRHKPETGGYYVVYEDGYKSYSPAKAFEEGYTKI